jgi:hypothetical protein
MVKKDKRVLGLKLRSLVIILVVIIVIIFFGIAYSTYGHVDPYIGFKGCNAKTCPAPVGIASYGIYNYNNIKDYRVKTSALMGEAYIGVIKSINPENSVEPANSASLQLNGILVVQNKNGTANQYLLQLVTNFFTNSDNISFESSINGLNTELTEKSLNGNVSCKFTANNQSRTIQFYYDCYFPLANGTQNISVARPFQLQMKLNTYVSNGEVMIRPTVYFSRQNQKINYSLLSSNFSIIDRNAESSYFLVDGRNYTFFNNGANLYDAELVFGGIRGGQMADFSSMNATLKLLYYNDSTNTFQNFPSYYNFGSDTGETTGTLSTSLLQNNSVTVTAGNQDNRYLGNSTNN